MSHGKHRTHGKREDGRGKRAEQGLKAEGGGLREERGLKSEGGGKRIEGRGKKEEERVFFHSVRYLSLLFFIIIHFLIQFLASCNQNLH